MMEEASELRAHREHDLHMLGGDSTIITVAE